MGISDKDQAHFSVLRQRAEDALRGRRVEVSGLSSEDIQYLLHELQVHQAELAIQNDELRRIQTELETSRDNYSLLYNFAPAGYCTVDRKDHIVEANHTLADLLSVEHQALLKKKISDFVFRHDQDKYYLYRTQAYANGQQQPVEIRFIDHLGDPFYARLESRVAHNDHNRLMIMLTDITEQRKQQHALLEQRDNERQRIARELHDGPVQVLSAINFTIRTILMDYSDPTLIESLESIQANLRDQIQALRDFSVDLRPPVLSQFGLEMSLRSFLEEYGESHPEILLRVNLQPVGADLSEEASLTLFRVCQEAFRNITKHAGGTATEVAVLLKKNEWQVRLEIQDNGKGFDLPQKWSEMMKQGHLGLIGMRERTEVVGGYLEVQSSPGKGTLIKASVPLNNQKSFL